MAKLVYGMSVSLDGYVDDTEGTLTAIPPPSPAVFRLFITTVTNNVGALYGRRIYELMQYWDGNNPSWDAPQREFAAAWQRMPKWVASRTLTSVGPNATLIRGDLEPFVRNLKASMTGPIDVAGPTLAAAIAPLIDEYQLYLRPYVLGTGKPFFAHARPPLRLIASEPVDDIIRLTYVPT